MALMEGPGSCGGDDLRAAAILDGAAGGGLGDLGWSPHGET